MTTDDSKRLNRLRAAAALAPQIVTGLSDGKVTHEKASMSAEFCQWALSGAPDTPEAKKLADSLGQNIERLESMFSEGNWTAPREIKPPTSPSPRRLKSRVLLPNPGTFR